MHHERYVPAAQDPSPEPAPQQPVPVISVDGQHALLLRTGVGPQVFRLVRDPTNPADPHAVAVLLSDRHVGWVAAEHAARYSEAVQQAEARDGRPVLVLGRIIRRGPEVIAELRGGPTTTTQQGVCLGTAQQSMGPSDTP